MNRLARSPSTLLLLALALGLPASLTGEDLRTITVRVVPELAWQAVPGDVAVTSENNSSHEKAAEFVEHMDDWIAKAFEQLDYRIDASADLHFRYSLEVYDPGSAAKRWAVGFGSGKSYVEGTVTIERQGDVLGKYRFSARPKTAGTKGLAKEVGPPLVLQIHNGEADEKLHVYKKKKKAKEKQTE